VSKNASKPVDKKANATTQGKKGLSLDEQIDQVYDELDREPEHPQGFIGKHLKKIRDKEKAEEAAKS